MGIEGYISGGNKFSDKQALKHESFREARKLMKIETHCNQTTGICMSNMEIVYFNVTSTKGYTSLIIGQEQTMKVVIRVRNKGPEDGHKVKMTFVAPASHILSKVKSPPSTQCDEGTSFNIVNCQIQNPLEPTSESKHEEHHFEFLFLVNTSLLVSNKKELYNATVTVDIPSIDGNLENNYKVMELNTKYLADIRVMGAPRQKRQKFNNNVPYQGHVTLNQLGPDVRHVVEVRIDENSSKDKIMDIKVDIRYPSSALYLYKLQVPKTHAHSMTCDAQVDDFNLNSNDTIHVSRLKYYEQINKPDVFPEHSSNILVDCETNTGCQIIKCTIHQLERGSNLNSYVRFELFGKLKEFKFKDVEEITVTTFVEVLSVRDELLLPPKDYITKRITATLQASYKGKSAKVNILIIIFSVFAGLLILAVIVFILYKKGFFKTKTQLRTPADFFQTGHRSETLTREEYSAT